jgi:hypothetical protein
MRCVLFNDIHTPANVHVIRFNYGDFQTKFNLDAAKDGDSQCCHLPDTYITLMKRLRDAENNVMLLTEGAYEYVFIVQNQCARFELVFDFVYTFTELIKYGSIFFFT